MADKDGVTGSAPAAVPKKPQRARGNMRKRKADGDAEDAQEGEGTTGVVRKARGEKPGTFSTRQATEPKLQPFQFATSTALQQASDQGATKVLETETAFDRDARARREAVLRQGGQEVQDSAQYRGQNSYVDYTQGFRREHTVGSEKGSGMHGPLRGSQHIRSSVRVDYQPDICKDYKETGFCGYGDACKFVHDRGDYKQGWELDQEWDAKEKALREAKWGDAEEEKEAAEEEKDDGLPFACFICRKEWDEASHPVATRCRHYFCEPCALAHSKASAKCFVCEQPTQGIFNTAHDINKKVRLKQEQAAAAEAGQA